jgi:hypothetical protein
MVGRLNGVPKPNPAPVDGPAEDGDAELPNPKPKPALTWRFDDERGKGIADGGSGIAGGKGSAMATKRTQAGLFPSCGRL